MVPDHPRAVVTRAPNGAARIVAVNIDTVKIGKRVAIVNHSSRQGPRFGVVVFNGGRDGGCGTELPVQVERMAAFINAPTIILAASNEVGRFPKVLTVIACPDLTCLAVNCHPPGIAQTVGPELRSRIFPADKWVVLRYRVRLRSVRM